MAPRRATALERHVAGPILSCDAVKDLKHSNVAVDKVTLEHAREKRKRTKFE